MSIKISTRGKSVSRKRAVKGITLIELLVALAIVGVIFAIAATGLRNALDVELKSSSRHLSSLIRYLRTEAITKHRYNRLVLDLGEAKYSAEYSEQSFVISPAEEEIAATPGQKKTAEEGGEKTDFQSTEGVLAEPARLGSGVFFKDASVSYLREKVVEGSVALYFFPDGYVTAAMINLRDTDDEDHYSIEVSPLSGKVTVEGQYRELPR